MRRPFLALLLAVAALPLAAQHDHGGQAGSSSASSSWTSQPLLLPAGGGRGERAAASLRASGSDGRVLAIYGPDLDALDQRREVTATAGVFAISPTDAKRGNYHWLVLREESAELVRVASTAWYFANPGPSPQRLLAQVRHELEIVPEPLPREHGSYRESEKWRFRVRWQGQPLAGRSVLLETEAGSRSTLTTDSEGVATVLFPRDLPETVADEKSHGRPARRAGKFVLSTEYEDQGRRYQTAFNHTYGEDGERGRSLGWGAAFALAGMVAALPLLRRRQQEEKKDA